MGCLSAKTPRRQSKESTEVDEPKAIHWPGFEYFDSKLMIHYTVDESLDVIGRQHANHLLRPINQLCTQVKENEFVVLGGYVMNSDYEPCNEVDLVNTETFSIKRLPSLPLHVHGGGLFFVDNKLILAGGWLCAKDQAQAGAKRVPWPFGKTTLDFWQDVNAVTGTVLLTLNLNEHAWVRQKFTIEHTAASGANPLELIAPGVCEYEGQLAFVGGCVIHTRLPSRKVMLVDPRTLKTRFFESELPRDTSFYMPIVAQMNSNLIVINSTCNSKAYLLKPGSNHASLITIPKQLFSSELRFVKATDEILILSCTSYALLYNLNEIELAQVPYKACKLNIVSS